MHASRCALRACPWCIDCIQHHAFPACPRPLVAPAKYPPLMSPYPRGDGGYPHRSSRPATRWRSPRVKGSKPGSDKYVEQEVNCLGRLQETMHENVANMLTHPHHPVARVARCNLQGLDFRTGMAEAQAAAVLHQVGEATSHTSRLDSTGQTSRACESSTLASPRSISCAVLHLVLPPHHSRGRTVAEAGMADPRLTGGGVGGGASSCAFDGTAVVDEPCYFGPPVDVVFADAADRAHSALLAPPFPRVRRRSCARYSWPMRGPPPPMLRYVYAAGPLRPLDDAVPP